MKSYHYKMHFFPGKKYSDKQLVILVNGMRSVAKQCQLGDISYQALTGERLELSRVIIFAAYDQKREMVAFCSSLILNVSEVGNVLHLGLTCVAPAARGQGLTHQLSSKLLLNYLLRYSLFGEVWVTNCACVISSLGNVALYFEDLYPSPYHESGPSDKHLKIAHAVNEQYREPLAINQSANFDFRNFIFEGSVQGTSFQKDAGDSRFYHRQNAITKYYQKIINFDRGDEVLQVGRFSLLTFPKYFMRNLTQKMRFKLNQKQTKKYAGQN